MHIGYLELRFTDASIGNNYFLRTLMFKATTSKNAFLGAIAVCSFAVAPNVNALEAFPGAKVDCTAGEFTGTVDCEGPFTGNASNQIDDGTELFDLTDWEQLTKIDTVKGQDSYANSIIEFSGGLDEGELKDNISWAFKDDYDLSGISEIFFTVKGGNSFSAYLWDGTSTSGTFDTQGIVKGNGKGGPGLSNIAIYYRGEKYSSHTPIPTPAAILPTLVGLFGAASKRRSQQELEENVR